MSTHHKSYQFRMRPTKTQEAMLVQFAGARRFVWNWALARWKDYYKETGRTIPFSQLSKELTALRKKHETSWMLKCSLTSLQQAIIDLNLAFMRFFKGSDGHPKFKNRKSSSLNFRTTESIYIKESCIRISKIGLVRIHQTRPISGIIKQASFYRRPNGNWYASVSVQFDVVEKFIDPVALDRSIGIDLGIKNFIVTSKNCRVPSPNFHLHSERKIQRIQRTLSRRQRGSKRREKVRLSAAKIQQKIVNQRGDFLHKLTTQLVRDHDAICIEDLNVKGLARTKLAKLFRDASMGEFRRQLEYKAVWNRKHLVVVDRLFPSSKTCNHCGSINQDLTLKDRQWECQCGKVLDRDLNAALNIRDEGLKMLAARHAESLNAHGVCVSPETSGDGRRSEKSHGKP